MKTSSLQVQLGAIDDGLLTTDRSIQKLEHLIVQLGEKDEDREGAERLLVHLAGMRRRFETVRMSLVRELASNTERKTSPQSPKNAPSPEFIR
jgi:hypothetical protein